MFHPSFQKCIEHAQNAGAILAVLSFKDQSGLDFSDKSKLLTPPQRLPLNSNAEHVMSRKRAKPHPLTRIGRNSNSSHFNFNCPSLHHPTKLRFVAPRLF